MTKKETVDHPAHYNQGQIEVITVIEDWKLGFHEGNALKYLARWKQKGGGEDLKKARWYLDRLIRAMERRSMAESFSCACADRGTSLVAEPCRSRDPREQKERGRCEVKLSKIIEAKINSYPTAHQMERWAELAAKLEAKVEELAARTQGDLFTPTPTIPTLEVARVRRPISVGAFAKIEKILSAEYGAGLLLRQEGDFFVVERGEGK